MASTEAQQALVGPPDGRATRVQPLLAVAGALLGAGAVVAAAAGAPGDAAFGRGLLQLLIVGVPILAGLYALRAPITARFGVALLGVGFAWSLTALSESSLSVPYTIGRLSTWLIFPCVVFLLLAVPDGRVARGLDRVLLVGVVVVLLVLFLGTAPLVQSYPAHTLWAACTTDCPPNALAVVGHSPAWLSKVVMVREGLVGVLWLGLFVSMSRRWRAGSPLQRRAMSPVFLAAGAMGVLHIAFHTARQVGAPGQALVALSSAWTLCIVAVCAAFLVGLFRRRMLLAGASARLSNALRGSDDPAEVRNALATALHDSTVELVYRDDTSGAWHDTSGRNVTWPRTLPPGHAATTIAGDGRSSDIVLIHDSALRDDPELLEGISGMVLTSWRHERLMSDLASAVRDLDDSRRRIAEAADLERARIERDLHDGAQQRLVALRMRLGIAEETLRTDPAAGADEVRKLGFEAEQALEELRSLSRGIYPPALTVYGVAHALREVARQATMPVHIVAMGRTRQPIEIESAVYFTCVEAIQNAMKHATTATGVWINLTDSARTLRFEVRDDGPGFTPRNGRAQGRGMRNMHDRIEAIGGRLTIDSEPGRGTRIVGSVPLS